MSGVRANWREINVIDLTDEEVAQMTPAEERWCSNLLNERHAKASAVVHPEGPRPPEPLDIVVRVEPRVIARPHPLNNTSDDITDYCDPTVPPGLS